MRDTVLVLTREIDIAADGVLDILEVRGIPYFRLNAEEFPQRASLTCESDDSGFKVRLSKARGFISLDTIYSVWYRQPVDYFVDPSITDPAFKRFAELESRHAIIGSLMTDPNILWMNTPSATHNASYKLYQLFTARKVGFTIPNTLVTNHPGSAEAFYTANQSNVIAKTLSTPLLRQDYRPFAMYSHFVTGEDLNLFGDLVLAPCQLQGYVDKLVEIRAIVVGREVFAAEIHSQVLEESRHDWRRAKVSDLPHLIHELPADVSQKCVDVVGALGLSYGALDLIFSPGDEYVFLEVNPMGQWHWIEKLTGLPISQSIASFLAPSVSDD